MTETLSATITGVHLNVLTCNLLRIYHNNIVLLHRFDVNIKSILECKCTNSSADYHSDVNKSVYVCALKFQRHENQSLHLEQQHTSNTHQTLRYTRTLTFDGSQST